MGEAGGEQGIAAEPDFREFIAFREIREEDIELIGRLGEIPKDVFLEHHNSFSGQVKFAPGGVQEVLRREREAAEKALAGATDDPLKVLFLARITYCELMTRIADRYGGHVVYDLNGRFEGRKDTR